MVRHLPYSDFAFKGKFYTEKSVDNDNTGTTTRQMVELFQAWIKPMKRTRMQTLTALGQQLADTVDVMIPHNDQASEATFVKYDDQVFHIEAYNPDDSWGWGGYDVLTLKKVRKEV
ncbi:phage head closure protein [Fructilactobacillus cliffordii]|uniref:phage head closure protein n=1 Tax=Fructilactobacillus cliffordii TaxID=2940299 RepID=UPI002091F163|nr:phage head closure protein [Fructilactobacillus cliffordii]USS86491.1 phage head closure protein [Fructilactobacillus cliffordii]